MVQYAARGPASMPCRVLKFWASSDAAAWRRLQGSAGTAGTDRRSEDDSRRADAGADQLARFRAEAQAVAQLQHPNIVQIHEIGDHDGLPFFSLEFCPGGSLDKKLQGNPQAPPRPPR